MKRRNVTIIAFFTICVIIVSQQKSFFGKLEQYQEISKDNKEIYAVNETKKSSTSSTTSWSSGFEHTTNTLNSLSNMMDSFSTYMSSLATTGTTSYDSSDVTNNTLSSLFSSSSSFDFTSILDRFNNAYGSSSTSSSSSVTATVKEEKSSSSSSLFTPTYNEIDDYYEKQNINLTKEQTMPHPHAKAIDGNGMWGYIYDPRQVRNKILDMYHKHVKKTEQEKSVNSSTSIVQGVDYTIKSPYYYMPFKDDGEMNAVCNIPVGEFELPLLPKFKQRKMNQEEKNKIKQYEINGYNLLRNIVQVYENPLDRTDYELTNNNTILPSTGKILCVIYTYEGKHLFIQSQIDTWGWKCDGFFASSTKTIVNINDIGFGAINLPHYGEESYNTMWQKTRSIIGYLYDNYIDQYDYFYICGDDTHLIVENLRGYLGIIEYQYNNNKTTTPTPVHLGHHVKYRIDMVGGGPGYVLNKEALRIYGNEALDTCENTTLVSAEDRYISGCIEQIGKIKRIDTADINHKQRFMGVMPSLIASLNPFVEKHWLIQHYNIWYKIDGHGQRWGRNVTSTQTISFHQLKGPLAMKRHHAILYNSCPPNTILYNTINNITN